MTGALEAEDAAALRALYTAHAPAVLRLAATHLGDHAAAEDVVQEVFVRAWRAADRYDARRASPRTWLLAIARNLVVDTLRERGRRAATLDDSDTDRIPATVDHLDRSERRVALVEAMGRLSADHRTVVARVVIGGDDLATVADALGVPVGTVKSRLFYGLRALRLALDELEAG